MYLRVKRRNLTLHWGAICHLITIVGIVKAPVASRKKNLFVAGHGDKLQLTRRRRPSRLGGTVAQFAMSVRLEWQRTFA